jgi:cell division protein ZapC
MMLKPSDKWNWYFCEKEGHLMLDLGDDLVFRSNLCQKLLVECAYHSSQFTVDDASDFQIFKESVERLDLPESYKAQLILNCVAAKRFHKPVQPKSWFFNHQVYGDFVPCIGSIVQLVNDYDEGLFIVLDVGDNASLCARVELDEFQLTTSKGLGFSEAIKVMHDRMAPSQVIAGANPDIHHYALVG